ncbi:MAG: GNAT family N-acetyltransferase, partial [Chloroflexi bacterium]
RIIKRDYCFIADTGPLLWGFICAVVRQPQIAQLHGLSLINGWRIDTGLAYLLRSLENALVRDGIYHIMFLALESWLVPPLLRQGFYTDDYILTLERNVPAQPLLPRHSAPQAVLRSLLPDEIGDLTALDHRAFAWPWRFSSGELVQMLMSISRFVVLEHRGRLVGYACTDVRNARAQIIRLAVDPPYQSRGFGRYLLADALDFAASAGAVSVTLNTQRRNQVSQRLYQGFGFRVVGRRIPVMLKALHG